MLFRSADWLEDLLHGISDGAALLAAGEDAKFLTKVALRMAPARNATVAKPCKIDPPTAKLPKPTEAAPDNRTLLQRLADKFS